MESQFLENQFHDADYIVDDNNILLATSQSSNYNFPKNYKKISLNLVTKHMKSLMENQYMH